jgi:hypothetical protein
MAAGERDARGREEPAMSNPGGRGGASAPGHGHAAEPRGGEGSCRDVAGRRATGRKAADRQGSASGRREADARRLGRPRLLRVELIFVEDRARRGRMPAWPQASRSASISTTTPPLAAPVSAGRHAEATPASLGSAAPVAEPWLTKQQLADHLGVTPRWIEMQQRLGLPRMRMGGSNRYRVSAVEAWLRVRYPSTSALPRGA